ncbi:MAG: hypothetical protein JWL72_3333 [Ilumatobacteraceae bacterium]|nr:hypothetical protein [Ilumatobacteraceae bacterium]MCU1389995.1 hypothetical protein [Ilumatobacteraceae bacterium]
MTAPAEAVRRNLYDRAMTSGQDMPPVAGVDFATYCRVYAAVAIRAGQPAEHGELDGMAPYDAAAAAHGIDPATWNRAQLVWGCRAIVEPDLAIDVGRTIGKILSPGMPDMPAWFPMPHLPKPEPIDPADPRLAPIDGVTIETYVRFIGTQLLYPGLTVDQQRAVAVDQLGFPADRWQATSEAWGTRVTAGPPVSVRYAELICLLLG